MESKTAHSMKSKMSWWPKGHHITACTFLNGPLIKHKETLWERVIFLDDPDTVCGVWGYSVLDSPAWIGSGLCSCSPVSCKITWVWQIPSKWNLTLVVVLSPLLCYDPSPSPPFPHNPNSSKKCFKYFSQYFKFPHGWINEGINRAARKRSPHNLLLMESSTNNFPSEFNYSSVNVFGFYSDSPVIVSFK